MAPHAKIGYLVGYQSTNIYRIWIPYDEEVQPERDVVFDEKSFFDSQELDEALPEVVTIMEIPTLSMTPPGGLILEDFEDNWITDFSTIALNDEEQQGDQSSPENTESTFTSASETTESSHTVPALLTPNSMGMPWEQHTPSPDSPVADSFALGPSHEIHGDVGELNIVEGPHTRKPFQQQQAYMAALELPPEQLSTFQEAYAVGALHRDSCLHRDQLPQLPRNWYELQRHPEQDGLMRAAQKEYEAVMEKKTFQVVSKQDALNIIPLTWVFDYRFDQDGYLTRYKAQICIRGDLQPISEQDTYAATVKMKIL